MQGAANQKETDLIKGEELKQLVSDRINCWLHLNKLFRNYCELWIMKSHPEWPPYAVKRIKPED